jgi:hypothetical protein
MSKGICFYYKYVYDGRLVRSKESWLFESGVEGSICLVQKGVVPRRFPIAVFFSNQQLMGEAALAVCIDGTERESITVRMRCTRAVGYAGVASKAGQTSCRFAADTFIRG